MKVQSAANRFGVVSFITLTLILGPAVSGEENAPDRNLAQQILQRSGTQGGLVVHLGCGDGKLTAALRASDSYIVHGLDSDATEVAKARQNLQSQGIYGKVSIEQFDGDRLPYVENLVNLVVSDRPIDVSMQEVLRVLAPGGSAFIKNGDTWTRTLKPRPERIDEWTHYLHDATGNAVAHDSVVGPPRHMQWVGSPRWSRHHDRMASLNALVSAGGRIFYIFDEGSTASIQLPSDRVLIARDAFNGTILWKKPIPSWHNHLWPFKSGPAQLPRRLVAVGDRVYVTLGIDAPLSALDAATGEVVRTFQNSKATEEVIESEGVLFMLVNGSPTTRDRGGDYTPVHKNIGEAKARVASEWAWNERERSIMAADAETGKILWRVEQRVVPLTLAAGGGRIIFHDGEKIVSLDRKSGDEMWSSSPIARQPSISTAFGPTLVVYRDVVLFSGGTGTLTSISAETGEILWAAKQPRSGHNCPQDVLVLGGLVWGGATASGKDSGIFTGRDPHTGEIKNEFPPDVQTHWFHQRCYRSKATDKYLLPSRTGIEFVDIDKNHWEPHHWVRGGCIYGILPCNGLVYTPPHSCACYIDAKLNGFCALAPARKSRVQSLPSRDVDRLERGPAYGKAQLTQIPQSAFRNPHSEWPTYRHDPSRSGQAETSVSADLKRAWQTDLGGKLSSVVIAGRKLFVAQVDVHMLHALDANSGETLWNYTAGGRIDSPPTIYQGKVLFGSADGWVYCLRAADGELIWRFRAAPENRRLVSFEQVESVWPVHGSVLVQDDIVYCIAGRSMFLDGGMRLCRLDPKTGRKISETILDDRDPDTGENLQVKVQTLNMPTALPDVLSSDGEYLYMRTQRFDMAGIRQEVGATNASDQEGEGRHLFCSSGFLDDTWFHRGYFIYGKAISSGAGGWYRAGRFAPAGRLLVHDDSSVYGFGRKPEYFKWSTPLEYHLFATSKNPEIIQDAVAQPEEKPVAQPKPKNKGKARKKKKPRAGSSAKTTTRLAYHWTQDNPFHVRAMVLASGTLFIAGPPNLIDEEEIFAHYGDSGTLAKLNQQKASYEGQKGALLWAVSASDGKKLAEYNLAFPPVWDGMAAADGRLFLSTTDGKVLCYGRK